MQGVIVDDEGLGGLHWSFKFLYVSHTTKSCLRLKPKSVKCLKGKLWKQYRYFGKTLYSNQLSTLHVHTDWTKQTANMILFRSPFSPTTFMLSILLSKLRLYLGSLTFMRITKQPKYFIIHYIIHSISLYFLLHHGLLVLLTLSL